MSSSSSPPPTSSPYSSDSGSQVHTRLSSGRFRIADWTGERWLGASLYFFSQPCGERRLLIDISFPIGILRVFTKSSYSNHFFTPQPLNSFRRPIQIKFLRSFSEKSSYQKLYTRIAMVVNLTLKFDNPGIQMQVNEERWQESQPRLRTKSWTQLSKHTHVASAR